MRYIQLVTISFARGSSRTAIWRLRVLQLLCWITFICEDATSFCNKWHTCQIFFCCCLVFGCFKADFCGYIWHPFLDRQRAFIAVARLTLALAKLSCFAIAHSTHTQTHLHLQKSRCILHNLTSTNTKHSKQLSTAYIFLRFTTGWPLSSPHQIPDFFT